MEGNKGWLKSFEDIGEAAVEARVAEGEFAPPVNVIAREWLNQRRMQRETIQREAELRYIRRTAQASWALALVTLVLVGITFLGFQWQKEDNLEQRDNAKALLGIQISNEIDKQFDSPEMRKARIRLAKQLLNNKEVTEFRVLDFFDKLAMYTHQEVIDEGIADQSYSYWVLRYWPAIKTTIEEFRKQEKDPSFYTDVEELYGDMLDKATKDGVATPNKEEILRFLKEEATLPE